MKAFMGNSYLHSFICSISAARAPSEDDGEMEEEEPQLSTSLTYIAGTSEMIKRHVREPPANISSRQKREEEEEDHLMKAFMRNSYLGFISQVRTSTSEWCSSPDPPSIHSSLWRNK